MSRGSSVTATQFTATATDATGNTSPCSADFGYTEDSSQPAPPQSSPPPPPPPPPPAPLVLLLPDSAAPVATVAADRKQNAGAAITVDASCNEPCTVIATGVVLAKAGRGAAAAIAAKKRKFKLRAASADLPALGSATLKLVPRGKKAKRALRKLVKRGAKAKGKITLTLTDLAGNSTTEKLVVKLVR